MRQVLQNARNGKLAVAEVPEPTVQAGHLLVRTRASVISAGTERMVVDFARKNLAGKAKARPDLVRKVMTKARRDGLAATLRAVTARLDQPLPLGYSAAGTVLAVGTGLEGVFHVGERVAMAGAGLANHAELNLVPESLATRIPDRVSDENAAFGTLGAIALHAVRNAEPHLGEVVAVIGVGLVGQLAIQLLALSGARPVALDFDAGRLALAQRLGAEATFDMRKNGAIEAIQALTGGRGCDAVLIAAATSSSEPFRTAAALARDRARIVLVGLTGTAFPYAEFMKKELNVVVSRSYGPGRYDPDFEGRNVKYPIGWVRWTETGNLAECLRLMSGPEGRRLDVGPLITHRFPLTEAEAAYALVTERAEPSLGVVLSYPEEPAATASPPRPNFPATTHTAGSCVLGVIGAGAFARSVLLPELKRIGGIELRRIVTRQGSGASQARDSFGFAEAATDPDTVLNDPAIDAVIIATRHDTHADLTARALAAGKAVLVEKPLALDAAGLDAVATARSKSSRFFQVGFNRRFAPHALRARETLAALPGPKVVLIRVNAGTIPADSWIQGAEGGGRVLGEMCHFVDFARFLVGAPIKSIQAEAALAADGPCDDVTASLRFADGSLASVVYTALGDTAEGKERIEAYGGGTVIVLEDFRNLSIAAGGHVKRETLRLGADKGIGAALHAFVTAVRTGGPAVIDEGELLETSRATLAVLESLRSGNRVDI